MIARNKQRTEFFTPAEAAEILHVDRKVVYAAIAYGTLEAFDFSAQPGKGRPRYRVDAEGLRKFQDARRIKIPPITRRDRPIEQTEVIDFFPD